MDIEIESYVPVDWEPNPATYPARCDVSAHQLVELRNRFEDPDDQFGIKCTQDEWPPRDAHENVFPIYFDPDELNRLGQIPDWAGTTYPPFSGNLEPRPRENGMDFCNAPLAKWRYRYPDIRFCGKAVPDNLNYCASHKNRHDMVKSAEEHLQTGTAVKTLDHLYQRVGPWKRLVGWGAFESLMGESAYEYGVEYREKTFDFSDADIKPEGVDDNGQLQVKCGYPTERGDAALNLFCAAMMNVQMLVVQPRIMFEDDESGERMMESKSIEYASLTAPTESDPTQDFETIESWSEHHLNLPLSRLVRDRPKLLERGGVPTSVTDVPDEDDEVSGEDIVLEIDAEAAGVETVEDSGTDPNVTAAEDGDGVTSESQRIYDNTLDESDDE